MLDAVLWFFQNIGLAFYNFFYALSHPQLWLDWSDKQSIMRFVYYGGSVEFFFVVFTTYLIITAFGIWKNGFLWAVVRGLEGFALYHKALALASVGDHESAEAIFASKQTGPIQQTRRAIVAHVEVLSQLDRNDDALQLINDTFAEGGDTN